MKVAYIDTSCLVSILFRERGSARVSRQLEHYDLLLSSNLLEAELRSSCAREAVEFAANTLTSISWVQPDRPLSDEFERVLDHGYVRGADLWHLACALFVAEPDEMGFLTLDRSQSGVARSLGFKGFKR